jgi:hypothetical protein
VILQRPSDSQIKRGGHNLHGCVWDEIMPWFVDFLKAPEREEIEEEFYKPVPVASVALRASSASDASAPLF